MISQNKVVSDPTPPEVISSWRDARLLVTDEFESPPVILKVEDSVVGTLGNFSASTGKAKSKKTFNVCAIVAAALTNGTVLNYSASLPPGKGVILYADTEQSDFHCKRVLSRILRLAGLSLDVHPDNLVFFACGSLRPKTGLKRLRKPSMKSRESALSLSTASATWRTTSTVRENRPTLSQS